MKHALNVSFEFNHTPDMNQQMGTLYYVLKLQAPVNLAYADLLRGEGDLSDRLEDCLDELDVAVCDTSCFPEACNLGWSTYGQEKHGDALEQMKLLRDFFLKEGCAGGEIIEMDNQEYLAFHTSNKTGVNYQRALDDLESSPHP